MKMSFRKYKISFVIAVLLSACSGFTDVEPTHVLTENNAFLSMDDVELHLTGIYAGFLGGGYYGNGFGQLADMMTDNLAENIESLGNFRTLVDWQYVANDGTISGIWATPYSMINDCNILLVNVEKFPEKEPGQKNKLKGQALAIRALAHFDLLRYFGQSYDRNSTSLGIPIKTESSLAKPTRNTVKEVYDQIYADLTEAGTLLSSLETPVNDGFPDHIDAIGVDAIMARVALYANDYALAISKATSVISQKGLADQANFPLMWTEDNPLNEVIWSVTFLGNDGYVGGNVFFSINNRVSFKPSQELLSLYSTNDVRYDSYFSSTTTLRPGQLVVSKYLGRSGATNGVVNWKALRTGEMYLIRAEAQAISKLGGGETGAMDDLNTLRAARITGYVNENLTGSALLNAIDVERRRELFMEGHRWFDLRRTGQSIARGGDCAAPATACALPSTSFRWIWPIPQNEIKANPNIAGQQNAGY